MRIVFLGTPDFAEKSLQALYESGNEILAVVTNQDKPKGRGMKLIASPVKEFAIEKNLKIMQPTKVRNNTEFIDEIKKLNPDLICVVAYGKILPKELLDVPKYGAINVHGSLLPKYRGAAPIQWAVLNGDEETGITTMFMDEGMDTGDMILKESVKIGEDETTGELWDRLAIIGAKLLVKTVNRIEEISKTLVTIEQNEINESRENIEDKSNELKERENVEDGINELKERENAEDGINESKGKENIEDGINELKERENAEDKIDELKEKENIEDEINESRENIENKSNELNLAEKIKKEIKEKIGAQKQGDDFTLAPMLNKEMSKIDWNKSAREIKNLVRGLNPIMGAYTILDGKKLKIWKAKAHDSINEIENISNASDIEEKQNGEIIISNNKNGLFIKTGDGIIEVLEVQGENGKKMDIKSFLNGNQIKVTKLN